MVTYACLDQHGLVLPSVPSTSVGEKQKRIRYEVPFLHGMKGEALYHGISATGRAVLRGKRVQARALVLHRSTPQPPAR